MVDHESNEPQLAAKTALSTALARLPAEQREAIELAVGARMTCQQIAERTGVTESTVQRRIHRGLQSLLVGLRDIPSFNRLDQQESNRS